MRQMIALVVVGLVGGVAGHVAARSEFHEVRAQRFVLEDADGTERAILGHDRETGVSMLAFYLVEPDGSSNARMGLYMGQHGNPMLSLSDSTGTRLVVTLKDGNPAVVLYDKAGRLANGLFPEPR